MISIEQYVEGMEKLLAQVKEGEQTEFSRGYEAALIFALLGARILEENK